jgi:hypothetical protein
MDDREFVAECERLAGRVEWGLTEAVAKGFHEAARVFSDFLEGIEAPLGKLRAAFADGGRPLSDEETQREIDQLHAEILVAAARGEWLERL